MTTNGSRPVVWLMAVVAATAGVGVLGADRPLPAAARPSLAPAVRVRISTPLTVELAPAPDVVQSVLAPVAPEDSLRALAAPEPPPSPPDAPEPALGPWDGLPVYPTDQPAFSDSDGGPGACWNAAGYPLPQLEAVCSPGWAGRPPERPVPVDVTKGIVP